MGLAKTGGCMHNFRLGEYRVTAGEYKCHGYLVLRAGNRCWQLRDKHGDIIDDYATVRGALADAQKYWQLSL